MDAGSDWREEAAPEEPPTIGVLGAGVRFCGGEDVDCDPDASDAVTEFRNGLLMDHSLIKVELWGPIAT